MKIENVEAPTKLENGASSAVIVSYTHKSDGGPGYMPNGLVLCYLKDNYDPYVTWNVYLSDRDNKWYAESGHYFQSIIDAAKDYEDRGGK